MANEIDTRDKIVLEAIANLSTELKSSISDLKDGQQKLDLKITKLEGDIKGLEGKFTGIEGEIKGLEGKIVGVEGKLTGLEGRLNQVDSTIKTIFVVYAGLLGILIGGLLTITGRIVFFSGKF